MKLDVLVFAAHPDDAEMSCGGTLCKLIDEGKKVGIVDLTRGEMGTRGTPEIRAQEAKKAAEIMGLTIRVNLGFRDAFFVHDEAHQLAIIQQIRRFQPDILLGNAVIDRHPDHGKAAKLVRDSAFLSGLRKITTSLEGQLQEPWRPKRMFTYIQDHRLQPDFVVDVTPYFGLKWEAIKAYSSQFYNPESDDPQTYLSSQAFLKFLEARHRDVGHLVGAEFGEGFQSETPLKINSPLDLI
ncbi:MAG: bacillithiol biosynthesis deacetylase BshB1 [Bacteroidota bacterium]